MTVGISYNELLNQMGGFHRLTSGLGKAVNREPARLAAARTRMAKLSNSMIWTWCETKYLPQISLALTNWKLSTLQLLLCFELLGVAVEKLGGEPVRGNVGGGGKMLIYICSLATLNSPPNPCCNLEYTHPYVTFCDLWHPLPQLLSLSQKPGHVKGPRSRCCFPPPLQICISCLGVDFLSFFET